MKIISSLIKENKELYKKLDKLEKAINKGMDYFRISNLFKEIQNFWNRHEETEEFIAHVFLKNKKSIKSMNFNHRELKGHKKVLNDFIKTGNEKKIRIAFDTDGRMLIEKLKKQIEKENKIFSQFSL